MLIPPLWATRRRLGPAAHLTLLLVSLICVNTFFVFAPYLTGSSAPQDSPADLTLTHIGFAAISLTGLAQLLWALEQMFPAYALCILTLLAQVLGFTLAATPLTLSSASRLALHA